MRCDGRSLCAGAGHWESSPADSRQTNWRYCQTMAGRGPQPLSWHPVGEMSETWLQISRHSAVEDQMDSCGCSWAVTCMLWSTNKVRVEPSQDWAYTKDLTRQQNYNRKTVDDITIALILMRNLTWRKTDMNFEEKITTYKEVTENSDASSKTWSRNR